MASLSGYAKIIITIQRETLDDVLTIVPDIDSDGYYASFNQKSVKNKSDCYFDNAMLVPYLGRFFDAIVADSVLPHFVQIDCPMYPSVLLKPSHIHLYLPILAQQLVTLQDDWPFETTQ